MVSERTHGGRERERAPSTAPAPALPPGRPSDYFEPTYASKYDVAVAVRRVAHARGRQQTAERLRELASVSVEWAKVIDVPSVEVRR